MLTWLELVIIHNQRGHEYNIKIMDNIKPSHMKNVMSYDVLYALGQAISCVCSLQVWQCFLQNYWEIFSNRFKKNHKSKMQLLDIDLIWEMI